MNTAVSGNRDGIPRYRDVRIFRSGRRFHISATLTLSVSSAGIRSRPFHLFVVTFVLVKFVLANRNTLEHSQRCLAKREKVDFNKVGIKGVRDFFEAKVKPKIKRYRYAFRFTRCRFQAKYSKWAHDIRTTTNGKRRNRVTDFPFFVK